MPTNNVRPCSYCKAIQKKTTAQAAQIKDVTWMVLIYFAWCYLASEAQLSIVAGGQLCSLQIKAIPFELNPHFNHVSQPFIIIIHSVKFHFVLVFCLFACFFFHFFVKKKDRPDTKFT